MRAVIKLLFSTSFSSVLLLVFAYLIAIATFIEDAYGTPTANIEIFRSKWLEAIMVLLAINFLGNVKKYNMISQKKWTTLLFHLAFVVVIIGAGITRYHSFEGSMPIREGVTSNIMYSGEPHLRFRIIDPSKDREDPRSGLSYTQPNLMAETTNNDFDINFDLGDKKVVFSYLKYIKNSEYTIYEGVEGGKDLLELVYIVNGITDTMCIESGTSERVGSNLIAFNAPEVKGAVSIIEKDNKFQIYSPVRINRMRMRDRSIDTVMPGVVSEMFFAQMHNIQNAQVVFRSKKKNAVKVLEGRAYETRKGDALKIKVTVEKDGKTSEHEQVLFGGPGKISVPEKFQFEGLLFSASYGSIPIELPFKVRLNDFIMETYAGSQNPAGYRSKVTLLDQEVGLVEDHEIFMNNVLDYKGYRFFQSSFDADQKGTVLSVNHDVLGTWVTYVGYIMLGLGFLLTFFNKNSRFYSLPKKVTALRKKRIDLTIIAVFLGLGLSAQELHTEHDGHDHSEHTGQEHKSKKSPLSRSAHTKTAIKPKLIPIEQANKFGRLIVQSADGRYEPVNTLAVDLLHKLNRGEELVVDSFTFSPEQFLLELLINGTYFEDKRIIKVGSAPVRERLGVVEGKYVSFLDFFYDKGESKLRGPLMDATRKDPKKRNRWDKDVIKITDKVNVFYMAQSGEFLKIFPSRNDSMNNSWVSFMDKHARMRLSGDYTSSKGKESFNLSNVSFLTLFTQYMIFLQKEEYKSADDILDMILTLQRRYSDAETIPTENKVDLEISYNKSAIFSNVEKGYMYLCTFLLIFALTEALVSNRKSFGYKWGINTPLRLFTMLFVLVFAYHTYGLTLRWYLTGHAPWSNGYEALVFIAWGTALSGLIFSKFSKITLAGTSFVAFLIIMTAGHENMDPQLTNLVPVLKSYWLIIHVACITTSYGFFGLGGVLGLIVLGVMLFKKPSNAKKIDLLTSELTFINEMTVTIGLMMAAVGTFLGGVWANESWGRYWGWDAKETWALVIVIVYSMLLHFRFVPGLRSKSVFNAFGTIVGFGSVCMTFFGVNFYFSSSIHSYAAGDPPAFPIWLWATIISIFTLSAIAIIKEARFEKKNLK
jgi:cytochrome c-type biogenesis protein CcsB